MPTHKVQNLLRAHGTQLNKYSKLFWPFIKLCIFEHTRNKVTADLITCIIGVFQSNVCLFWYDDLWIDLATTGKGGLGYFVYATDVTCHTLSQITEWLILTKYCETRCTFYINIKGIRSRTFPLCESQVPPILNGILISDILLYLCHFCLFFILKTSLRTTQNS